MTTSPGNRYKEFLAGRVKEARAQKDWSLEQLGLRAHLPPQALAKVEQGEGVLSIAELNRVASVLGQAVGWFFPRDFAFDDQDLAEVFRLQDFPPEVQKQILQLLGTMLVHWQETHEV